jgi:hypothetical protein
VFIPDQTEAVTAIRPDGTTRGHTFPLAIFTTPLPTTSRRGHHDRIMLLHEAARAASGYVMSGVIV